MPPNPRSRPGTRPARRPVNERTCPRSTPTRPGPGTARTPATVWCCASGDGEPWPAPIIETVIAEFSRPGHHVVLLTPQSRTDDLAHVDGVARRLGCTCRTVELTDAVATRRRPVPHRAGLAHTTDGPGSTDPGPSMEPGPTVPAAQTGIADLIITTVPPGGPHDDIGTIAAELLRTAGVLTVLTHCDWTGGRLLDPTGAVVAACQNTDMLYLQHIVALHPPTNTDIERPAGMVKAHDRMHDDVLVFAQSHRREDAQ